MLHPRKKNLSVCVDVRLILFLVWKTLILVLVWGTYYVPATYVPYLVSAGRPQYGTRSQVRTYNIGLHPKKNKKNSWYQRALRCQLRGRPFHPSAGRPRFSGEAHPGPATLTQSSSFSCEASLQIESRLLLCCAPVTRDHATQCQVYSRVHAADAAVQ